MNKLGAIFLILTFTPSLVSFGQNKDSKRQVKITRVIQQLRTRSQGRLSRIE